MNTLCINRAVGTALIFASVGLAGQAPHGKPVQAEQARPQPVHDLFSGYWEDYLRSHPEAATSLGDKRYNDRWSDLSCATIVSSLRRDRLYEKRLSVVHTAELSAEDKLSIELLVRILREEQESAQFKEWEMPVNQIHGIHFELPQLVSVTPFDDAKDYENYIARLRRVPRLFDQLRANMRLGMKDGHMPAKLVSEKVIAQVNAILAIKP